MHLGRSGGTAEAGGGGGGGGGGLGGQVAGNLKLWCETADHVEVAPSRQAVGRGRG
jgi:hypothetical protein